MSETKTYVFPESGGNGGGSGMMAMLAPLLQQKGIDPNLLVAMNGKNNNSGFGGEGSWFIWVIFLFFLMGWGNNGNGWGNNGGGNNAGGIPNLINNDAGRELLMSAIQGNGQAINTLATNLNCSVGQIQQSINSVMTQIQGVGNQIGMSSQQIINSVQAGNCQIAQAIADCCCKTQNAITTQGYESQLAICNQTNTLVNTANQNTLSLRDGATANTNAILGKLDAMQNQALLDKIDALREAKSALQTQLSQEHQTSTFGQMIGQATAPLGAALGDLSSRLAKIECKQPETVTVPYSPIAAVPNCVAYQYGLYGGFNPYAAGNCFWG